jgi:hypothetical protein
MRCWHCDDVQTWINMAEDSFPVVFDRGVHTSLGLETPGDDV